MGRDGKTVKRGKTDSPKRSGSTRRVERSPEDIPDWTVIDPKIIAGAIGAVALRGGAIRFGYSSDGGCFTIGIYGDGDPYTEFTRTAGECVELLEGITERWNE